MKFRIKIVEIYFRFNPYFRLFLGSSSQIYIYETQWAYQHYTFYYFFFDYIFQNNLAFLKFSVH